MRTAIYIVGIGPGDPSLLTLQAAGFLTSDKKIYLRTSRHPVADWLSSQQISYETFDRNYITEEDFDTLYSGIAEHLAEEGKKIDIVYAVPNPEKDYSVLKLIGICKEQKISFSIIPGVSDNQICLSTGISQLKESPVSITAAYSLSDHVYNPSEHLLINEIDNRILAGSIKLYLSEYLSDDSCVLFYPSLTGLDYSWKKIPLYMLDRQKEYDHTTSVLVPAADYLSGSRSSYTFDDLINIMRKLRSPDGCPWDNSQTHDSLKQYMIEEAWEAVNSIDEKDMFHLADELGDVLYQIVFHAIIGEAYDEFTVKDVITNICRKMISRHPHVFGTDKEKSSLPDSSGWEKMKRQETGRRTVGDSLDDISSALPALKYSLKTVKKMNQSLNNNFSLQAYLEEIRHTCSNLINSDGTFSELNMGILLLQCSELCRIFNTDGELILHETVDKIKKVFKHAEMSGLINEKSPECLTFQQLCVYLRQVKGEIE